MIDTAARPVAISIANQPSDRGPQDQLLTPVIHRGTAPVSGLSAGHVVMPPGHMAKPHVHHHSELIVAVLEGHVATLWGETMHPMPHQPGDMVWIPAGLPHAGVNLSATDPVVLLEFRTDPEFNRDVELMPGLDAVAAGQADQVRNGHH